MYIELNIKEAEGTKTYNYNVANLPIGPQLPWKMIFQVDLQNEDVVKLTKMQFIQNKVLAYTEKQSKSNGADIKLSILAACTEMVNNKDFTPDAIFDNEFLNSMQNGIQVIPTEKFVPDVSDLAEITYAGTVRLTDEDITGLSTRYYTVAPPMQHINIPGQSSNLWQTQQIPSNQNPDQKVNEKSVFKPMTLEKAHASLKIWQRGKPELSPADKNCYLWERIQGIPENVPKETPIGWFKPPINQNYLLNVNYPDRIFSVDFHNVDYERVSMKVTDFIHKYIFDIRNFWEQKYDRSKRANITMAEAGAGICIPPGIYKRIMYDEPAPHYLQTAGQIEVIKKHLEERQQLKNQVLDQNTTQATTPIGFSTNFQTNNPPGMDNESLSPTSKMKEMMENLNNSLTSLNIDYKSKTFEEIGLELEKLRHENSSIDISGTTPMEVDNEVSQISFDNDHAGSEYLSRVSAPATPVNPKTPQGVPPVPKTVSFMENPSNNNGTMSTAKSPENVPPTSNIVRVQNPKKKQRAGKGTESEIVVVKNTDDPFSKFNVLTPTFKDTVLLRENIQNRCQKVKWEIGGQDEHYILELYVPNKNQKSVEDMTIIIYFGNDEHPSFFPTDVRDKNQACASAHYKWVLDTCYVLSINHSSLDLGHPNKNSERIDDDSYEIISSKIHEMFGTTRMIHVGHELGAAKLVHLMINSKFTNTFEKVILGSAFVEKEEGKEWDALTVQRFENFGSNYEIDDILMCRSDADGREQEYNKLYDALQTGCKRTICEFTIKECSNDALRAIMLYGTDRIESAIVEILSG